MNYTPVARGYAPAEFENCVILIITVKCHNSTGLTIMNSNSSLSNERYKVFIENINDGVYELDNYGNFSYFNDSMCKILGYSRKQIKGQNFSKFMDAKHVRAARNAFNKIWVTREGFSDLIWEIIDKDGQVKIIELSAYLIISDQGDKKGFRGIARDVTEKFVTQKALRESELRYQRQYRASRRAEERSRIFLDFIPYPMVVFSKSGNVIYLNPAFTETFGWELEELRGKPIPFIPPGLQAETNQSYNRLLKEKIILRQESRRLTKDGRILDVVMRGAVFSEKKGEPGGLLVFLRDITQEKRMARNNDALLRVSTALPKYPDLEELLDYISRVVQQLLNTKGAVVILLDEEKNELFFKGAAYDDTTTQKRIKEIRFPSNKGVSGRVIRTGKPAIVPDLSTDPDYYTEVGEKLQSHARDMLVVPLRSSDRIIGVLCAMNKKEGKFEETDVEMLTVIAGGVALYIENVRFSGELKKAYREVSSLNRAKDKTINHLSHELITPIAVLSASLNILSKKMPENNKEALKPTLERAQRNLNRILDIQYQVEDIMQNKRPKAYHLLSRLLDQCTDELEALVAEEVGETSVVERVRNRIEEIFGPKDSKLSEIRLDRYVRNRLEALKPQMPHRQVDIITHIESVPLIYIPSDVLRKVVDGLIKNAIENTPDEGRVEITVRKKGMGAELMVHDYGVGIIEANQTRIFEGFFSTQETMAYSSRRAFDFNAGGKGADLLRMKIFSERYHFNIAMTSTRCGFIPEKNDICPGKISKCRFCSEKKDCYESGQTAATVFFPSGRDSNGAANVP